MEAKIGRTDLTLVEGDITELAVDAIVNAANERLVHSGGVAQAISRKGGPAVQRESDAWVRRYGRVQTGSAAITSGGNLPARHVVHAVGPIYRDEAQSAPLLASAVRSALQLADEYELTSVALPAISTGIYGYPLRDAAKVLLGAAIGHLRGETGLEQVVFCLYGQPTYEVFEETLASLL